MGDVSGDEGEEGIEVERGMGEKEEWGKGGTGVRVWGRVREKGWGVG